MGSRPERGAYGNARGKPDKQVRARRTREQDPRWQASMAAVQAEREALDRQIAESAEAEPLTQPIGEAVPTIAERMAEVQAKSTPPVPTEPVVVQPAPTPKSDLPGRFKPCHCSHMGHPDVQCSWCGCSQYRPVTAPDPLARKKLKIENIDELLLEGRNSKFDDTIKLTHKIEDLITQLKQAVLDEDRKAAEERAREAAKQKVRDRMAELQAEMERLQAELGESTAVKPVKTKAAKKEGTVYPGAPFSCNLCERDDIMSPQGLGAHKFRAHGVKGTSRD